MLFPFSKTTAQKFLPLSILSISLGFIYFATLAPGLSWANDGADGGDLISATATNGIAHPTGYPLYLLIAKLFQLLPTGSLAFRTNLLSALAAILAAALIYIVLVYPSTSPAAGNWLAGMVAGYALGLSPVFWSQAVITEVYTLHTALIALSLVLSVWPAHLEHSKTCLNRLRGLVPGLAVGNHLTAVFLLPSVLLSGVWHERWKIDWPTLIRMLSWFTVGLLIYLTLPLRALSQPIINWGNPQNFENFAWLVSGDLYQRNLMEISSAQILERIQAWAFLIMRQFEIPGLTLGLIGLIYFFKPNRLYFITIYNAIIFSLFAIIYTTFDSYVYLLPVFLSFVIWIGLGLDGLLRRAGKHRNAAEWAACAFLLIWFVVMTISRWPQVDASHDFRAEQFGSQVMRVAPANAIVFAKSDRAIFALWYFHFALKQRADLTVIATDLLHFEWYAASLRSHYPDVHWPDGFLWVENIMPANTSRPVCQVSYFDTEIIDCKLVP